MDRMNMDLDHDGWIKKSIGPLKSTNIYVEK